MSTAFTLVLAVLSGYAFARLQFPGRRVALLAVVGTIVIPLFLLIVPLFRVMSQLHLIGTFPGVITLYVTAYTPLGIWLFYNYVRDARSSSRRPRASTAARASRPSTGSCSRRCAPGSRR